MNKETCKRPYLRLTTMCETNFRPVSINGSTISTSTRKDYRTVLSCADVGARLCATAW